MKKPEVGKRINDDLIETQNEKLEKTLLKHGSLRNNHDELDTHEDKSINPISLCEICKKPCKLKCSRCKLA